MDLCDVLSHDPDACPTDVQTAAVTAARARLEKRWTNICRMCLKREQRLEYVTVSLQIEL